MICIIMFTNYTAHAVAIDASSSGNWSGYMAWFETDGTTKGNYADGSNWGVAFIKTLDVNGGWATVLNEEVAISPTGEISACH